ncbi:RusA family crossover junction endodeoxyribonuclease [Bifidobacterium magnum]|uniref:Endodeoxyribonuclease RusA n=1 Tax=Bifidobacterium magnum TaxID=1692 RepID=A0A087B9P4_9BIFI|nr:RusA family crossover junction endodeoxyribonuclease [Bifidobacterium magnum]KFI67744.1 endodeoxyribonuclease RusA [Bifidobacterium magnum]
MELLSLTVLGDPVSKQRPRFSRASQRTYTPAKTQKTEKRIREQFQTKYPNLEPLEGLVRVELQFYMASRQRKDTDNLVKLVTDALNGVAYKDDVQICELFAQRWYPDRKVAGANGRKRNRKAGDPLTYFGQSGEAKTVILIQPTPYEEEERCTILMK